MKNLRTPGLFPQNQVQQVMCQRIRNGGNPTTIGAAVEGLLLEKQETFLVPTENIANVMCLSPLSHVALVLSRVRYSKIPVLNKGDRLIGLIGLINVVDKVLDLTSADFEKLNEFIVADVIEVNVPVIGESWDLEEVLHLLVDASFLSMVDDNQRLKGIVTCKKILRAANHMTYELERHHLVLPKLEEMKVI